MNPALSAQRILFGTGLGLLLATGLGYISGVSSIDSVGIEVVFAILGLILIMSSKLVEQEDGFFSSLFPNESRDDLEKNIQSELSSKKKDEEIGDAWAKLEHTMLTKELEEE